MTAKLFQVKLVSTIKHQIRGNMIHHYITTNGNLQQPALSLNHYTTTPNTVRADGNALTACVLKVTRTSSILVKWSANLLSFQTTPGCWWSIWFETKMIMVTVNISDTSCQLEGESSLCVGGVDTILSLNPVTPGFETVTRLPTHLTSDDLSKLIPIQPPVPELSCYLSQAAFPSVNSHKVQHNTNRFLHLGF